MSVMQCDRNGCTNILCDRHSSKYGTICNDCFIELIDSCLTPRKFMKTEKVKMVKELKEYRKQLLELEFPMYKKEQL